MVGEKDGNPFLPPPSHPTPLFIIDESATFSCWNVRGIMAKVHIRDCKCIIKEFHLDFLCMIETKLQSFLS